jgi:hypothetical protein
MADVKNAATAEELARTMGLGPTATALLISALAVARQEGVLEGIDKAAKATHEALDAALGGTRG